MKVTVEGAYRGNAATVTWEDGALTSEPSHLRQIISVQAEILEGTWIGPDNALTTERDHLSNPYSFVWLCWDVLGHLDAIVGLPDREDLPAEPEGFYV